MILNTNVTRNNELCFVLVCIILAPQVLNGADKLRLNFRAVTYAISAQRRVSTPQCFIQLILLTHLIKVTL